MREATIPEKLNNFINTKAKVDVVKKQLYCRVKANKVSCDAKEHNLSQLYRNACKRLVIRTGDWIKVDKLPTVKITEVDSTTTDSLKNFVPKKVGPYLSIKVKHCTVSAHSSGIHEIVYTYGATLAMIEQEAKSNT